MPFDNSSRPSPEFEPDSIANQPEPEAPHEAELLDGIEPLLSVQPLSRPPHPNFWWSLLWCAGYLMVTQLGGVILGAFIGLFILMAAFGGPKQFLDVTRTEEGAHVMMQEMVRDGIICSQILSVLMGLFVLTLVVGRSWPRHLALRLPALGHVLLVLLGAPAMIVVGNGVQALAAEYLPSFSSLGLPGAEQAIRDLKNQPVGLLILMIGVGPAIGEELWCRGFLGRGLVGHYGAVGGILLTSFLFGAIHLDPPQAVMAMVMGVLLHFSYLTTRSLWVPMLLHFVNNSLGVLGLTDHLSSLEPLDHVPTWQMTTLLHGSALLLLGAVGWALYQSRARVVPMVPGTLVPPSYPGVASPTPGSGLAVVGAWPGWAATGLVGLALTAFLVVTFQVLVS